MELNDIKFFYYDVNSLVGTGRQHRAHPLIWTPPPAVPHAPLDLIRAADATYAPFHPSTARPPSVYGRLAAGPPSAALRQQLARCRSSVDSRPAAALSDAAPPSTARPSVIRPPSPALRRPVDWASVPRARLDLVPAASSALHRRPSVAL